MTSCEGLRRLEVLDDADTLTVVSLSSSLLHPCRQGKDRHFKKLGEVRSRIGLTEINILELGEKLHCFVKT